MKKNIILALILIISANLLSCKKEPAVDNEQPANVSNLQAQNTVQRQSSPSVPFKGNFTVTANVLQGPPIIHQTLSGSGTATHLGNFTLHSDVLVQATPPQPFQVNGTGTFTAANGDKFYTIITGLSTPSSPDGIVAHITHTITGGTGRFQNASGTLVAISTASGPISSEVNINGDISF